MKRIVLATAGVAVIAVVAATLGSAQNTATTGPTRAKAAAATVLPKLPADIVNRKRLIVGVKCDTPPFGYIDVRGKNAGVDVEIAKWFARYAFGREQRLTFVCAPTAVREPLLTNGRVDLVISTFTYTADRDTRIDFSRAYYRATGRLLVKNDSPIQRLSDINGKRVATTSGSVYDRWVKRCFSSASVVVTDSVTNAVIAFNQGRADAVMFDDTSLALIAATDPSARLTSDLFLEAPYGIGIKQGNVALKRWVDARLNLMKQKDLFYKILQNNIAPRFLAGFAKNVLRPKNNFGYRSANLPSIDTVCP
jgi:polar amino acid transport system substrate-binding protein